MFFVLHRTADLLFTKRRLQFYLLENEDSCQLHLTATVEARKYTVGAREYSKTVHKYSIAAGKCTNGARQNFLGARIHTNTPRKYSFGARKNTVGA